MTIDIHLAVATAVHRDQLVQLHTEASRRSQPAKGIHRAIGDAIVNPGRLTLVALHGGHFRGGGEVVGFLNAVAMTPGTALIENVYITPRHRAGGIGTKLMTEAFRLLRESGFAAVVATAPAEPETIVTWLARLGIQFVPGGHSLGIAERDGRVQVVSPPAPLRTRIGAGFLPGSTQGAISWGVEGLTAPTPSTVAEAFIAAFDNSRSQVHTVLDDLAVSRVLSELGRPDLIHRWLQPEAFTTTGAADA